MLSVQYISLWQHCIWSDLMTYWHVEMLTLWYGQEAWQRIDCMVYFMFADHSRILTGDTSTSSPTLAAMMMLVMRTLGGAAPRWRSGRCLTTESSSASRSPSSPSRAREMTMRRTVRRIHQRKIVRCSNCWWKCVFLYCKFLRQINILYWFYLH